MIAVLSLYRPGPWEAGAVDAFVRRRQGKEALPDYHPKLRAILEETYGLLLYQEQVMRIAVEIAGLSLAEADELRRALAQGGPLNETYRTAFIEGSLARGLAVTEAEAIFDSLIRFSGYSFNKAHTAGYARITLQTAYLKAHYPTEYFAALLASQGGYYGTEVYAREAQRLGIPILSPDVNRSGLTYAPEGNAIRMGLLQVSGIGLTKALAILAERQERGKFRSLQDLMQRVRKLTKASLRALSDAGALTHLPPWPKQLGLFETLPADEGRRSTESPRQSGRDLKTGPRVDAPSLVQPPVQLRVRLERWGWVAASQLKEREPGEKVLVSGAVISSRRLPDTKGECSLQVLLEDQTGFVEVVVPSLVYERDLIEIDPAGIAVRGKLLNSYPVPRIIASAVRAWKTLDSIGA